MADAMKLVPVESLQYAIDAIAHLQPHKARRELEKLLAASPPAPAREDGYVAAFYEIAEMMGLAARPQSPSTVWAQEMKPRLAAALSPAPATADKLRVAKEALEKIKTHRIGRDPATVWTGSDLCRDIATKALAALNEGGE